MEIEQDDNNTNDNNNQMEQENNMNFHFINRGKYVKKRSYLESLTSSEKIIIKEKELKFLLKLFNQIKEKVNSDYKNIFKNNSTKELIKDNNNKYNYKIDYSIIDLNEIIFQLYQTNNLSDDLKRFVLKKLIDNAIKVERTFQNYFNPNNMPNKQ